MFDFKIKPMETKKDNVARRAVMKNNIIPNHLTLSIFNGRVGSGKSQLALNLLMRPEFYGKKKGNKSEAGYFNEIYVMSPTVLSDDLYENIPKTVLPDKNKFPNPTEEDLRQIINKQKSLIKEKGIDKSPRILLIFDDIQSLPKFLKSTAFREVIFAQRHINASVWILGQSWTRTPRYIRLQASNVFFFEGNQSENELIATEFACCGLNKKQMLQIINIATKEPYSFLYINMKAPKTLRFRKNLDVVLKIKNEILEEKI